MNTYLKQIFNVMKYIALNTMFSLFCEKLFVISLFTAAAFGEEEEQSIKALLALIYIFIGFLLVKYLISSYFAYISGVFKDKKLLTIMLILLADVYMLCYGKEFVLLPISSLYLLPVIVSMILKVLMDKLKDKKNYEKICERIYLISNMLFILITYFYMYWAGMADNNCLFFLTAIGCITAIDLIKSLVTYGLNKYINSELMQRNKKVHIIWGIVMFVIEVLIILISTIIMRTSSWDSVSYGIYSNYLINNVHIIIVLMTIINVITYKIVKKIMSEKISQ